MLNIDGTLILQIANFLVLLVVMNIILYKPIRGILAKRDEEMASRQKMIDDYQDRVKGNEEAIESGMVSARKEGYQEKESLKAQGQDEEKGVLQEAGAAVERKLTAAKQEIETKIAAARETLESEDFRFFQRTGRKNTGKERAMIRLTSKKWQTLLIVGMTLLFVVTLCGFAFASGGGGAEEGHDKMLNLFYRILNFVLLVIILFVVIKKTSMLRFFGERREEIKEKLDALTKNARQPKP
jgi:F-type H+-transporting ATPase subunit b